MMQDVSKLNTYLNYYIHFPIKDVRVGFFSNFSSIVEEDHLLKKILEPLDRSIIIYICSYTKPLDKTIEIEENMFTDLDRNKKEVKLLRVQANKNFESVAITYI